MNQRQSRSLIGAVLVVVLAGCSGGSEIERRPLEGTVTVNGKPMATGRIRFTPAAGTNGPAASASVSEGRFTGPEDEGVVVGEYRVEIEAQENLGFEFDDDVAYAARGGRPLPPNEIPLEFNRNSRLTATVRADEENTFNFPLEFQLPKRKR